MKIKRILSAFLCLSFLFCMIPSTPALAEVMNSFDVMLEKRTVWIDSDFSTLDDGWVLSNGMYHDGDEGVIRIEEATASNGNIAEANYSLAGLDFGENWNIRFRMKLDEEHQGKAHAQFCYGGYRTYWDVTPDENKFSLQGNGSRTDRETLRGIWYEYLFQYYQENEKTKVKIWRRPEGDNFWLDIFTGYTFGDVNLYTGPPALRFFGGDQSSGNKLAIDDVRVYSGTYAKLNEPVVQGSNVTACGLIDTSDYGMTEQRQVTLIAASYDKEYGYTREVQSTTVVIEPGAEQELNHTFRFSSLNSKNDSVVTMMWDNLESCVPLASATGDVKKYLATDSPVNGQEVGVFPTVSYNEVSLNGYLGEAKGKLTASLIKDNKIYAITQSEANENGMVSTTLAVNPACESGTYTLRIQHGNAMTTETQISLQCHDSLPESYGSITEIIGQNIVPHKAFDFTAKNASVLYTGSGYHSSGSRYFNQITGMSLDSTTKTTYWRYAPVANWFVIGDRRAVKLRVKMTNDTEPLDIRIFEPNKNYAAHEFVLAADGITTDCTYKTLDTDFSPGTEWVEYLIVKTSTGIKVYASRESFLYGRWVLVLETIGVNTSYASSIGGIHFQGTGYISSMDIYNTSASVFDSAESIMGNSGATIYDFRMNENFIKSEGLTYTGTYAYGEDGLTLTSGSWKFLPSANWYALRKNNAVFLRTKMVDPTNTMTVRLSNESGTAKIQLASTGITAYSAIGAARKLTSFSGMEWIDYLILQNQLGGYSVYATNDSLSNWYKVAETEDYPESSDGGMGVEISGSGIVQAVKQFEISGAITDAGVKPTNAKTAYYQEEFFDLPTEQSNVIIQNGMVEEGNLIVRNGSYSVKNGGIPLGGYAEFRVFADGAFEMTTSDGEKGISLTAQNGNYMLSAVSTQSLAMGDGGNEFRTWRIVRNSNGTYSGYCKADGENAWYPAFLNITGKTISSDPVTSLNVSDGTMNCDYLMLYGPTKNEALILTDGYGTKVLSSGEKYQYHDSIRALVTLDETESRTILFAEYVRGALSHWERKEIPPGGGVVSVPYAAKNTAADIKVFLWDSLPGMAAVGKKQSASHNWTLSGSARDLNGGISLNLEGSANSTASFAGKIGDNFDIEWTMRINSFRGTERAIVYTGKEMIELTFNQDGISYQTKTGSETVSCFIGTMTHTYRLVGKDGACYLYLDDVFVGIMTDFPESTETPRIDFRAGS